MRYLFLFGLFTTLYFNAGAQNLSFNCPKDTVLGCAVNCFNLVSRFPDIKSLGSNYTVTNVSQSSPCLPYVDPGAPGPSTNLIIDDRYSTVIPLPFTFPFFGVPFNSLIASTNGFISFDVSKTGLFSHYDDFGDLPNAAYDRAIIMGPYHDLDPSNTSSPTQQIKYQVTGAAPNRKWILSFYRVPLYGTSCTGLNRNTHQIILNESSGIIEVDIVDKQICFGWNNGRAMVGLQDYNKTQAVMAPNRRMTDPPWGSIGMNETWRFIPTGGTSLYRRVELLDGAGTTIAVGDTTRIDANTFEVTFPNICPPANTLAFYVVKTTFARLNDLTNTMYSLDTFRVLRNAMPASATSLNSTCGSSTGTITATATGGTAPLSYTLMPGAITNATGLFSGLAAGNYTVIVTDATATCTNTVAASVGVTGSLTATATSTNASCPGVSNASITVTPTTGFAPFTFSANGGPSQPSGSFINLTPGTYTIVFTDASGCNGSITRTLGPGTPITATSTSTATTCAGVSNGSITVNPTSGVGPYTYSLDGGTFQTPNIFTGLAAGTHVITVQDSRGCSISISRIVNTGNGLNASITQTPTSCTGVNDGTITVIPTTGTAPFNYSINGGPAQAANIFTGLASGSYTAIFTDGNGCTGTRTINVVAGTAPASSFVATNTSCPGNNDGTITVTAIAGSVFTLNPGNIVNNTGVFTGLAPNNYTVSFVTPSGCSGTVAPNPVVNAGPFLTATVTNTHPVCANINDGVISINPQAGSVAPYTVILNGPGGPYTNSGVAPVVFNNLAAGTYNFSFTAANGCTGIGGPVVLITNSAVKTPVTITRPLCNGSANGSISFNTSGGVGPYQYSLNGGTTYQASNIFSALIAGTYLFKIKDNAGCEKDTSILLTQPTQLLNAISNNTAAGCSNNDGSLTSIASGGTNPYTYSISGPTVNTSGATSGIFTGLAIGAYTISAKDANGCTADVGATVILIDNMFLTLGADATICKESSISFNPQTNTGTSVFAWSALNAAQNTIANATIKNATATPLDTSSYILNATWGTCTRADTIVVNILHKPIAHAGNDTAICNISYALLNGNASNVSGPVSYSWSPVTSISTPLQQNTTVYPAGNNITYTYLLTVKDNYGCNFSVTDEVKVRVQPPVPAFAGNDTNAVKGIPHQLYGAGGVSYLWSPASPLNSPFNKNPLAILQSDTKFILEVTDVAGCIGYDTVYIKVFVGPTYHVPNAFSPNNDGRNDVFRPIPVGIDKTDWFRIFNRYGQLVFETNKWLKGWDGMYQGKRQPLGAYIWFVKGTDRDGKKVEMKGTVMLVR